MESAPAADRVTGFFPLSIPTSLALESAVGIHPDIPPPSSMPILKYDALWINLRTLYRNFIGSLSKGVAQDIHMEEIVAELLAEMEMIPSILKEYTRHDLEVVYYVSNYKGMESKYPHAQLRMDTTTKQIDYTKMFNAVLGHLNKHHSKEFLGFDLKLTGNARKNTLIITNYAYDLLSHKSFGKLTLLESHTGRIREQAQWYAKYYNGKELSMIPFREDLIQIFGDSETFKPLNIAVRKEIIDIAVKRNWSAITTSERIKTTLEEIQHPYTRTIILDIIRNG